MALVIRARCDEDLDSCVITLKNVYAKNGYPIQGTSNARAFLTGPSIDRAWVAEVDGRIVGHVAASKATTDDIAVALWQQQHPGDRIAVMERLFVDPDARGGGVARQLVHAAVSWSRHNDVRLVLFALEKDEAAAGGLYERLGWIKFGKSTYIWGDDKQMGASCFISPLSPDLEK